MVVSRRDGRIVTRWSYPAHALRIMQRALTLNPERLSVLDIQLPFGGSLLMASINGPKIYVFKTDIALKAPPFLKGRGDVSQNTRHAIKNAITQ